MHNDTYFGSSAWKNTKLKAGITPEPPPAPMTPEQIHARIENACALCLLIKTQITLDVTRATLARERLEQSYRTEDQILPAPSKDFLIGVAQGLLAAARTVNTR